MNTAIYGPRQVRRFFWIVATLALLAGLVGMGATSARATYPGKNGRIAFATDPSSGQQVIKTVRRDGTHLRRLVASAQAPDWSPDANRIVFERDHATGPTFCSIQTIHPDGSGIVDLTGARRGCDSDPSFTPDGRWIVFTHQCNKCHDAMLRMNIKSGARTRIRRVPHKVEALDLNVSPDGKTIAFVGQKNDSRRALFTLRMKGTHLDRLTSFKLDVGTHIDWSPNGRHLVVTEYQDGPGNIATVRPDGSGYFQVTHHTGDVGAGGAVYAPSGRWVLFRRQNDTEGNYAIWKMRPDGSQRARVRGLKVHFGQLDWGIQR